jgi:hypothetical protein
MNVPFQNGERRKGKLKRLVPYGLATDTATSSIFHSTIRLGGNKYASITTNY